MENYDMFGGYSTPPEKKKPSQKHKSMQEMHGILEGKNCSTCKHLLKCEYHGRTYYKCELWAITHGAATDVRLKDQACGKYYPEKPLGRG